MVRRPTIAVVLLLVAAVASCKKAEPPKASSPEPPPPAAPPPPPPSGVPAPDDVTAPPEDAEKRPSGLASKRLVNGTGTVHPTAADGVKVHYTVWTPDGKTVRSTLKGEPEQFQLGKSIKGWIEGLPLMVVGEKRRFWVPAALTGGASANAAPGPTAQVFDVELLEIEKAEAPLSSAALAQPADAKRTSSGLAYKILKKGAGGYHPKGNNTVEVHYTGWTRDGKEYDSSVRRGRPAKMLVSGVFPGWAEALPLLVVGDKARFWFPAKLAFGTHPPANAPAGGMVFDIELLGIE
jgi:FKBP-type peptidyl-prolyl cis-trans isomerase